MIHDQSESQRYWNNEVQNKVAFVNLFFTAFRPAEGVDKRALQLLQLLVTTLLYCCEQQGGASNVKPTKATKL